VGRRERLRLRLEHVVAAIVHSCHAELHTLDLLLLRAHLRHLLDQDRIETEDTKLAVAIIAKLVPALVLDYVPERQSHVAWLVTVLAEGAVVARAGNRTTRLGIPMLQEFVVPRLVLGRIASEQGIAEEFLSLVQRKEAR